MSTRDSRRPWPMKWIAVAIVVFVVPYTYLTLHYRKPGRAYDPYGDTKDRANTGRLLSAGYQRTTLAFERPADPARWAAALATRATVQSTSGGLPDDLAKALIDKPALPLAIESVAASTTASATAPYSIQFTCTLPDRKHQISSALMYHKEGRILIVPSFETIEGDLRARSLSSTVLATIPAGSLKPGSYAAVLIGSEGARTWTVQVH